MNQLPNRDFVLNMERLTHQICSELSYLISMMPDWQNLDLTNEKTKKKIVSFKRFGADLAREMEELLARIKAFSSLH
jgi:hypothetical protein